MGDVSAANASTTSAGDEPGVLPAALSPVLWRHLATSGPPVDLRTALAAACACRVFREVLQEVVIRGKLERPSQVRAGLSVVSATGGRRWHRHRTVRHLLLSPHPAVACSHS